MNRFTTLKKPPQNIGLERAVKKVKSREQNKKLAFPHPHKGIFSYKIRGEKLLSTLFLFFQQILLQLFSDVAAQLHRLLCS